MAGAFGKLFGVFVRALLSFQGRPIAAEEWLIPLVHALFLPSASARRYRGARTGETEKKSEIRAFFPLTLRSRSALS